MRLRTLTRCGLVVIILSALLVPAAHGLISVTPTTELEQTAVDAYVYFYPLVVMDMKRREFTIPVSASGVGPENRFNHMRTYPNSFFRSVVRPNFDTLYSSAWLDLSDGPLLVSTPDLGGRYFILQMLDMWTDVFASPSKRTIGTEAHQFIIVPPDWKGSLPNGPDRIQSPTKHVWIIGRIRAEGEADIAAVHALQDQMVITPMARAYPEDWIPTPRVKDVRTTPQPFAPVDCITASAYFRYAAELLAREAPHAIDAEILAKMQSLGIVAGRPFEMNAVGSDVRDALESAMWRGPEILNREEANSSRMANGWQLNNEHMGVYGEDYLKRAIVAKTALGANVPEDAVYPMTEVDATGSSLVGSNVYVVHFAADRIPPVDAFWSITLYNADGFANRNSIHRYAIGSGNNLQFNQDGSLDVFIQHDNPGKDREANWLPCPCDGFNLAMRLYWPEQPVLTGSWTPPAVRKQ